jgi:hypothetical protein
VSKEVVIRLRDDIDGDVADDVVTREFTFDGVNYEIELNDNNFEEFRLDIKKWIQAARVARPRRKKAANGSSKPKPSPQPPPTRGEVRAWAQKRNLVVSDKGNISNEIRNAYIAAHARRQKGH